MKVRLKLGVWRNLPELVLKREQTVLYGGNKSAIGFGQSGWWRACVRLSDQKVRLPRRFGHGLSQQWQTP